MVFQVVMGSERQCGLGSLVPMSCRGRAEAFARRLHTRLRSLGAEPPPGGEVSSGSDVYFDLETQIESPQSPQSPVESGCLLSSPPGDDNTSPPSNSDSDATYYDLDADSDPKLTAYSKLKDNQANKVKLAPDVVDHLFQNRSDTPENQSPIKTQPLARDVISKTDYGSTHQFDSLNALYSPIKFDDCSQIPADSPEHISTTTPRDDISSEGSVLNCVPEEISSIEPTDECKKEDTDSNLSNDGDDNDNDDRPQRVRRCSSLRSGKTPPGTPGRKKIVRFADVLGLDLADVKTFMDDIPNIPKSAFEDLQEAEAINTSTECFVLNEIPKTSEKCLVAMFQQPGDQPNFLDILNSKNVCLENARVQEGATIAISGTVRVRNLDFHKSVQIRYTLDNWKSFSDLQASYVPNSCDGFADKFQFLLYAHTVRVGQTLEFAVRFMCKGCQYWDNNSGANYCFQCLSSTNSTASLYAAPNINPIDNWHASFY